MTRNVLLVIAIGCVCHAVSAAGEVASPAPAESAVVATVGDEPICAGEVDRLLHRSFPGRKVDPDALPWVQAQLLEQIIDRRLVLAYAKGTNSVPSAEEADRAIAQRKAKLAAQHQSMADYLRGQSMDESDLQRQVVEGLVWNKLTARYVTDERLQAFFQAHRREFDGTELSVSHILLRYRQQKDATAADDLMRQAAEIRQEIEGGQISFAAAARKYSGGPSAKNDGELGYIRRHGAMDEAFSHAAFGLEVGQISQPVRTPFGVHLIRCNEIKPGGKQFAAVRNEVADALARELLEELARLAARPHTRPVHGQIALLQARHARVGSPQMRPCTIFCVSGAKGTVPK